MILPIDTLQEGDYFVPERGVISHYYKVVTPFRPITHPLDQEKEWGTLRVTRYRVEDGEKVRDVHWDTEKDCQVLFLGNPDRLAKVIARGRNDQWKKKQYQYTH